MNLLITGSNSQLAREIRALSSNYKKTINFIYKDLPDLDISNFKRLVNFILDNNVNGIINCAAYTDVEKAEINPILAKKINSTGVSNLVNALKLVNGKLIHISSDYVFDGTQSRPYKESDPTNPVSIYGQTKREGEKFVINSSLDAIVIRTSWLYSNYGNNFVKKILKISSNKNELKVVKDQIGSPTYAFDLAKICLDIMSGKFSSCISKKGRLYHYSNQGEISWFEFANEIIKFGKQVNCKVLPILSKDYKTKVKRPQYSVLDKSKIKKDFNLEIPNWKDSLKNCIKKN